MEAKKDLGDVLIFVDRLHFPKVGENGKIYIDKELATLYYWNGSTYVAYFTSYVAIYFTSEDE